MLLPIQIHFKTLLSFKKITWSCCSIWPLGFWKFYKIKMIFFIIMTRVIPYMQLISWFAYSWIWWCQVDLEHSSVVILWSQLECPLNMEPCSPNIIKKRSPKWTRLSRIWRIKQIEEGVIHWGLICLILHILRKPNAPIALLFIQNNS